MAAGGMELGKWLPDDSNILSDFIHTENEQKNGSVTKILSHY